MRIIGGLYRHRLIDYPSDERITRPTKDRIRESIFNALGNIEDKVCLDLYAGSGSMGLEALSRGARFCYFSDVSKDAVKCVQNNAKKLQIPDKNIKISMISDLEMINSISFSKDKIDVVFIDPPYKEGHYQEIVDLLFEKDIMANNAIIVVETNSKLELKSSYKKIKEYKHGEIMVYILWY